MTTVQSTSSINTNSLTNMLSTGGATATAGAGTANGSTGLGGNDPASTFLKLLVTQLQQQDPLNPMDNAQMTSQLAQISTVNGINQLNSTVQALAASMNANQYLQASALVGHNVLVAGSGLQLAAGSAQGGANLPQAVDDLKVTITNSTGAVVRQLDLGAQPAGSAAFTWDGKTDTGAAVADGSYSFSLAATASGQSVTASPLMFSKVTGVIPGSGTQATQLQLGALGLVSLTDVRQID